MPRSASRSACRHPGHPDSQAIHHCLIRIDEALAYFWSRVAGEVSEEAIVLEEILNFELEPKWLSWIANPQRRTSCSADLTFLRYRRPPEKTKKRSVFPTDRGFGGVHLPPPKPQSVDVELLRIIPKLGLRG